MTYIPYPKMLYRDHGDYKAAADEAEHDELVAQGYMSFWDLPPANPDGLESLTDDQLRAKLLDLARVMIAARSRAEIIFQIRFQLEAAQIAKAQAETPAAEAPTIEPSNEETDAAIAAGEVIYGSSSHPEKITIGAQDLDIGPIVRSAFVDSGMSIADWNAAASNDRDDLIQLTIDRLSEAGDETVLAELSADGAEPLTDTEIEAFVAPVIEAEQVEAGDEHIRWARAAVAGRAEQPASAQGEPEATVEADPLDHDHDGHAGGSLPVAEPEGEKAELISQIAEMTGRRPHPGSKIETLRAKLVDLTKPGA